MESAIVIKVKYGDTLRRFSANVKENDALDLNMEGLRAKIISLFNFPPGADFTMTYIDEDGDRVTLVDDGDLHEIMNQCLRFLKIDVQLNDDKAGKSNAKSSGSSKPLRSPSTQHNPLPNLNAHLPEALKSLPDPLLETLSKLSHDMASKAISSNQVITDLIQSFSKMGQSEEDISQSESSENLHASSTSKEPRAPKCNGLKESLTKRAAFDVNPKSDKEVNVDAANTTRDSGTPDLVDLNMVPPSHFFVNGMSPVSCGSADSTRSSNVDKHRKMGACFNPYNECPFSGAPVANDSAGTWMHPRYSPLRSNYRDTLVGMFHKGIRCDGCGVLPITGPRFKSKVEVDYDLCSICFAEMGNEADYIRIDRPVHHRYSRPFKTLNDHDIWHAPSAAQCAPYFLRGSGLSPIQAELDSRFVSDVNVLDGTLMAPLTRFTKIWRMRNSGSMPWPRGTHLVWIGGDKFSDAFSVEMRLPAEGVPAEGELDIAVDFTAPESPGRYISYWRMQTPSGLKFGQRVWVLIQIDEPVIEPSTASDSIRSINLNLPPEGGASKLPQSTEVFVSQYPQPIDMNVAPPTVEGVFLDTCSSSCMVPEPMKPVVNDEPPKKEQANLVNDGLLINPDGFAASVPPTAPASSTVTVTYPIIDLTAEPLEAPVQHPSVTRVPPVPIEVSDKEAVENALLKELEDMGFSQVNLNKEILRKNEYDLERSVDDLCGVADWDPILEELNEMGFCDKERNRRLLRKHEGSIKRVVMDLLIGEKA